MESCSIQKSVFSKLKTESVNEVSCMKDKEEMSYAIKEMISMRMSLNIHGRWEESQ